ncbi:MAG: UDP-N-acetylmuramoyl-L-alanyl-D-glutamate--2,6-diaminopimelate ligase [Candidatus Nealsonbacteria bacterium]|nr:UDP-N-acetylmuramoyl-L-alanyl-D-glutamate--2,6-diaminopimelate ligase [Candidatus Nealsonbacteria bacterium]
MKSLIKKFIPSFLLSFYHLFLAFLGAVIYGFPSKKIKVIGVTGTNGKTTVVDLTTHILEKAGYKVASLSSIKFKIAEKERKNVLKMTMPGRLQIQKFLREAVNNKCQYLVLEVTSEGIKQHRHRFIDFQAAVFTNLTPEHIEAHGGFENYKKAKGKLFQTVKGIHIINIDDENAQYYLQFKAKKKYTYGFDKGDINNKDIALNLQLPAKFNIYNALAAICLGLSQGISLAVCKKAVQGVKGVPGRMEEVISTPFKVVVDYAFTPNALEKVYQTLKPENARRRDKSLLRPSLRLGQLICVLGACGGGRDKWKRPVLGKIASKYCDEVIITNEDPYDEDPMKIIQEVAEGAGNKAKKIIDRREAISKALKIASPNDVIVITGKGSESLMCVAGGKKIPWDDREAVKEENNKLTGLLK